jgi:hypothetical protein
MVRDSNTRWATKKPNHKQALLLYGDGAKVAIIICKDCFDAPNFEEITNNILCEESAIGSGKFKQILKLKGIPTGIME